MNSKILGLALLSIYASSNAIAQDLERFEVSGSKLGALVDYSKTEVNREKIAQLNPASTLDLLKKIPHIVISENGQAGGFSYISIRGGESNFTLIMIDGVPVNDSTNSRGGGFDFNQLDPNIIETVEVYRGGVSSVFGNGAISGVINFVTRRVGGQSISVEAGNLDQLNASASISGDISAQASALLSASSRRQKQSDTSEYENQQFLAKLNIDTNNSQNALLLSYSDQQAIGFPEDSGGELFAVLRTPETRDSEQWLAGLKSQYDLGEGLILHSNLSWHRHQERADNPGIIEGVLSGVPPSNIESDYKKLEADVYLSGELQQGWTVLGGLNASKASGSNQGFVDFGFPLSVDFTLVQEIYSAFVETSLTFDQLNLDLGARYDSPSYFSSEVSYRANLSSRVTADSMIYGSYNEGYKLPSFFALAHPLVGNADLQPERSKNWEIGLQQALSNGADMELIGFYNQFSDLVDFDAELFTNINRSSVDTFGVEFNYSTTLTSWLSLDADVSYIKTDIKNSDAQLRRRPRWVGGISANATWRDLSVSLNIDSRSEFTDSSIATGTTTLGGFTVASLAGNWQLQEQLKLTFNIDNVLNKSYQESVGFVADDVAWRLGMVYAW